LCDIRLDQPSIKKCDDLTSDLLDFIKSTTWTYAKTMPKWKHEYIVQGKVDESLFRKLYKVIMESGYEGSFYARKVIYIDHDGYTYWAMGNPDEEVTIINRTQIENSYMYKLAHGTLPRED